MDLTLLETPRGIRGYKLLSSTGGDFSQWRVAGSTPLHHLSRHRADVEPDLEGEDAPDYVRGPYNEGGWWFERVGSHLVCTCVNSDPH